MLGLSDLMWLGCNGITILFLLFSFPSLICLGIDRLGHLAKLHVRVQYKMWLKWQNGTTESDHTTLTGYEQRHSRYHSG